MIVCLASLGTSILGAIFVLICLFLIFMVVITPSQEGGMAAAFGGMGSDSFFGTKAHQHINKFTLFLAVSFLLLAVVINLINARTGGGMVEGKSDLQKKLEQLPPPAPQAPRLPPPPK
jgi:preprotein translocase subunit SecG